MVYEDGWRRSGVPPDSHIGYVTYIFEHQRPQVSVRVQRSLAIYTDIRLYVNFFQPVLKLVDKVHIDGKTIKKYDQAATPYRRVLASEDVAFEDKARLSNLYVQLNPVTLRNRIDLNVGKLWKIIK